MGRKLGRSVASNQQPNDLREVSSDLVAVGAGQGLAKVVPPKAGGPRGAPKPKIAGGCKDLLHGDVRDDRLGGRPKRHKAGASRSRPQAP